LSGSGSIADSIGVTINGTGNLNITNASGNESIITLSGVSGTTVTLGANTLILTDASGDYEGIISGTGGLTIAAGTETLSGADTYTGATTINGGSLALSGSGSIADSIGVTINGTGNLNITNASGNESIITLSGVSGTTVTLGANTLILTDASGDYEGIISGTGGLTIAAGTETLSGADTYTGATTINGGSL